MESFIKPQLPSLPYQCLDVLRSHTFQVRKVAPCLQTTFSGHIYFALLRVVP